MVQLQPQLIKDDDPVHDEVRKQVFAFLFGPLDNFVKDFKVYNGLPKVGTMPEDDMSRYSEVGFFGVSSANGVNERVDDFKAKNSITLYKYPSDCCFSTTTEGDDDGLYHVVLCHFFLGATEAALGRQFDLRLDETPCVLLFLISFGGPVIREFHGIIKQLRLTSPCDVIESILKISMLVLDIEPSLITGLLADFKDGKLGFADVLESLRSFRFFPELNEIYLLYLEPLVSSDLKAQMGPFKSLLVNENFWQLESRVADLE